MLQLYLIDEKETYLGLERGELLLLLGSVSLDLLGGFSTSVLELLYSVCVVVENQVMRPVIEVASRSGSCRSAITVSQLTNVTVNSETRFVDQLTLTSLLNYLGCLLLRFQEGLDSLGRCLCGLTTTVDVSLHVTPFEP